jgi:single-strand DNA-binding protein
MLNKAQLIGFLGGDPEIRYTTDQKAIAKFSLATTDSWKDKDGKKQEKTEWHNIVIYGKLGEIAGQHLKKGSLVFLEGSIKYRSWDKDGATHYITEIIADSMKMLPSGKSQSQAQGKPSAETSAYEQSADRPF